MSVCPKVIFMQDLLVRLAWHEKVDFNGLVFSCPLVTCDAKNFQLVFPPQISNKSVRWTRVPQATKHNSEATKIYTNTGLSTFFPSNWLESVWM